MQNTLTRLAASLALAYVLAPLPCCAEWFYVDADVGPTYLKVPDINFFRVVDNTLAQTDTLSTGDGEDFGGTFSGRIGVIVPIELLGAGRMRVEFIDTHTSVEQSTDLSFTDNDPNAAFSVALLDSNSGSNTSDGRTLATHTNRKISYDSYELLAHQDYRVGVTIYGGASLIKFDQDREFSSFFPGGPPVTANRLDESLDTKYVGGKVGLACRSAITDLWTLALDGSLGFYSADTAYSGAQVFLGQSQTVALNSRNFALGTNVKIDFIRRLNDHMFLTAFANLEYLNYAPQIDYGVLNAGTPVSIAADELLSVRCGLRLTVYR